MANQELGLAIDIGSTSLRICEFEYPSSGGLILRRFGIAELNDQQLESNRVEAIASTLKAVYDQGNFTTKKTSISLSGQAAFMRFVNLPPVSEEEGRIKQIVEYEAKQNVPFPMDEVIWDYQLLTGAEDELEVMFVVIKNDVVETIIEAITSIGLKPQLIDFAPSALYNVARANHIGDKDCAMILDIGGRCTTLLFLDGKRFFARIIPIGGFSITQQIAKEFAINNTEAETLKRRHGFVALGGAYEEPESEVAATISKIIRNVMTRLHGEVNRSISVYRTQQKGNKPTHLYLCGGSSTMAFTDHFFSEKLRIEVSYLNPFKIITLDRSLDIKLLEENAHLYPTTIGVGLRNSLECPIEISLTPESVKKQQSFATKKPFIIVSCLVWFTIIFVLAGVNWKKVALYKRTAETKKANVDRLNRIKDDISNLETQQKSVVSKIDNIIEILDYRYGWSVFYNSLQLTKPQDVWFTGITVMTAPKQAPTKKRDTSTIKKGSNPFSSRRTSQATVDAGGQDMIVWFDLVGHSIAIPSTEPPRKIFTDDQIAAFSESLNTINDNNINNSAENTQKIEPFWGTNQFHPDIILTETLLKSLQNSVLFSDDPEETRILESRFSENYRNLTTFRIQLKLQYAIITKR